MNLLPISLDQLIFAQAVESTKREFKATWSVPIREQVIRTICAYANDFQNLNGGYIVLGIEEENGSPRLPPRGLENFDLEQIQKEIRGDCNRIDPPYHPVLSPEVYQDKPILVIWSPGGETRPYQAPISQKSGERAYYVRLGSETVEAKGVVRNQLIQMTAKVPFDDRRHFSARVEEISPTLLRHFLSNTKSDLIAPGNNIADLDIYRAMRLIAPVNGHEVPRNVALLFFVNDPEVYFPGARIDVAQFGDDAGGDLIEEKIFRGPIPNQINQTLEYLNTFSTTMLRKVPNQAEVQRTVAFPYEAMEEALVNAVYHRSYEESNPEPVKVLLYPDRMEIISYPGPVQGIEQKHLQQGASIPYVPARNRRIGELLKSLRLAEMWGTGIPKIRRKMIENGSPEPVFTFDEARSYFCVTLPAHPQYVVIQALREAAHLWAIGEKQRATQNLAIAYRRIPSSGALLAQLIEYYAATGDLASAENEYQSLSQGFDLTDRHLPYLAMARAYLDRQETGKALAILEKAPSPVQTNDTIELAILYKRSGRYQDAHRLFASRYDEIRDNPKAVHEFAQTKIRLASATSNAVVRKRLNQETEELLRRAVQLSDDPIRLGWCWYDLARVLNWLKAPQEQIRDAFHNAMKLLPGEKRIQQAYEDWQNRQAAIK